MGVAVVEVLVENRGLILKSLELELKKSILDYA